MVSVFQLRINDRIQVTPAMTYRHLHSHLEHTVLAPLLEYSTDAWFDSRNNGDLPRWRRAVAALPSLVPSSTDLFHGVRIGTSNDCSPAQQATLRTALQGLMPWRKGPFELFGINIDTEWRSDWKWERLQHHLSPLTDRIILDVGCGNGYHCFRMVGEGARLALGVDPQLAYSMQFKAIKHYAPELPVYVLPTTLERALHKMPADIEAFDTVFSMGVLYHRRSPIDHLLQLKSCLRPGGELVLETLVVEGPEGYSLTPSDRYARMPNVWFIPSCKTMMNWLQRCGFLQVRLVDLGTTTIQEQRSTEWMQFQSLVDSLNPEDHNTTVEGLPAPQRAVFIATAP